MSGARTRIRIHPGGRVVAIYDENVDMSVFAGEATIRRASHVEPIQHGDKVGRWYVDFSPLGDGYLFCLSDTFGKRSEALKAERAFLEKHYIGEANGQD